MKYRNVLILLAVVAGLCFGDLSSVYAQAVGTDEFTLEEITVTAQKREENQQKVAIPMDVISGEDLAATGKMDVDDILRGLANVMINYADDGMRITARGLADYDATLADVHVSTPMVALNVDGTYNSSSSAGQNLFDVERVEVLYGPQSTMYASNSPGGIVNVVTAAPETDKYSASASLKFGNYTLFTAQAMVNAPIIAEKLAMRLAVEEQKRESYVSVTDQSGENTKSARLKTLYQPNDKLSITVTVNWQKKINGGMMGGQVQAFDTQDGHWYTSGGPPGTPVTKDGKVTDPWTARSGGMMPPGMLPNEGAQVTKGISGDINWDTRIGSLSIVPNYTKSESHDSSVITTTNEGVTYQYNGYTEMRGTQKGFEARMVSDEDFLFKWIVGINYYESENARYTTYDSVLSSPNTFLITEKAKAAFGNITYPLTDRFRVDGGIRYSEDRMNNIGSVMSNIPSTPYSNPDYKLGIEYDLEENQMLYATYATSYRANAFRWTGVEKVKSYTVGSKNRFFDNRLQLNGSVYYYNYQNQNVMNGDGNYFGTIYEDALADPNGNPVDINSNGISGEHVSVTSLADEYLFYQTGSSRTIGMDVSAEWILTSSDRVNFSVAYLDSQWTDCTSHFYYQKADGTHFWPTDGRDYSGKTANNSPKWTVATSYEHNFILGSFGILVPHIDLMYKSNYTLSFQEGDYPVNYQESYYTFDGNVLFNNSSGKWSLNAYVKNATNYAAKTFFNSMIGLGISNPRTYGAVLSVKF